jgi:perosamine synthetase
MSKVSPEAFAQTLRALLPASRPDGSPYKHYLQLPAIGPEEAQALSAVIQGPGNWVSNAGPDVPRFERALAEFMGGQHHVVACVNGTTAIQIALQLAGVGPMHGLPGHPDRAQRDMVICPSLTFVATANAIAHRGAVPAFVDAEPETLGMDPEALRAFLQSQCRRGDDGQTYHRDTGMRVGAIMPVHIFGNPCRIQELAQIAQSWGIPLVEDAAESLGSWVGQTHTGFFGVAGATSFNGNKLITTGGGGAIMTRDPELAARARHITATAKDPSRPAWQYWHDEVAYNYRMPNLNAAFGMVQVDRLPGLLQQKERLFQRWSQIFEALPGVSLIDARPGTTVNRWLIAARLPEGTTLEERDAILAHLNGQNLFCRPIWVPMHKLPMYQHCPRGPLGCTERLEATLINIPSTAALADL